MFAHLRSAIIQRIPNIRNQRKFVCIADIISMIYCLHGRGDQEATGMDKAL